LTWKVNSLFLRSSEIEPCVGTRFLIKGILCFGPFIDTIKAEDLRSDKIIGIHVPVLLNRIQYIKSLNVDLYKML
jgi:hypothetical protein